MNRALQISAITLALTIRPCLTAQTPQPPAAPLPTQLTTAHKIFIGNAGDQENADCLRAYNVFYAGIQGLKNFELVLDPKDADLVLELHYEIALGQAVASHDSNQSVRQFRVALIDPKSHTILWTLVERTNYALLQSNRNKNLDETIGVLVNDFNLLVSPAPIAPSNKSKVTHF